MQKSLKELRKSNGLRQEDVAKQLGVTRTTYLNIEKRGIDDMTTTQAKQLAEIYDIDIVALINHCSERCPHCNKII